MSEIAARMIERLLQTMLCCKRLKRLYNSGTEIKKGKEEEAHAEVRYTLAMQTQQSPLLKIDDATVQTNGVQILRNLSLEIPEGQHTAIVGPNGSGKSTLIKLIARQLYPLAHADGRQAVSVFDRDTWNVFELRTLLGIVSTDLQSAFTVAGGITGLEAVLSGYFASQGLVDYHAVTPAMHQEAVDALKQLGASSLAEKPMEIMSAGEARRILIARALVHHPRALLLDEPTTGLDIAARRQFLETLRIIAAERRTLLLVTHHIDEIVPEIERVILMKDGTIYIDGEKENVLTSSHLSAVFGAEIEVHRAANGYFKADLCESNHKLTALS
jgi:iron complex transport system ATP-binding protein